MASVRMTNSLRREIADKAFTSFDTACPRPQVTTEFADKLRQAINNRPAAKVYKRIKELQDSLGDEPKSFRDKNSYSIKNFNSVMLEKIIDPVKDIRHSLSIEFTPPVSVLSGHEDRYSWGGHGLKLDELDQKDITEIDELFTEHLEKDKKWEENRSEYVFSIEALLNKCNTLKQLLEVWPAAENLVPDKYIQRMHEKITRVERAKKVKEEISFDPNKVNNVVLTAKLMGG